MLYNLAKFIQKSIFNNKMGDIYLRNVESVSTYVIECN
jgi:hypothetical protein